MKSIISFIILVLLLSSNNLVYAQTFKTIQINNNKIKVEIAKTAEETATGLMDRTYLPSDQGMLFIFDAKSVVLFWMYHTLIPLDIIFIKDKKIIKIVNNAAPCKSQDYNNCPDYPDDQGIIASEVLEVNGGYAKLHNIHVGDKVIF